VISETFWLRWALVVLIAGPAMANQAEQYDQDNRDAAAPSSDVAEAKEEVQGLWPVDAILDTAVKNIARRYALNDEQTKYTSEMMNTRVKKFLDEYQDEIWPLIRDLGYWQQKGSPPDADSAKRLGPTAVKILKAAKDEIFRANEEWGKVLTDQQKRVHEFDLREMDKTFNQMERNFDNWGKGRVAQRSIFPQPKRRANEPPTPTRPNDGRLPVDRREGKKHKSGEPILLTHFDAYAQKFIADYQLTATQREAVGSILREVKKRAETFRESHRAQLDAIKTQLAASKSAHERRQLTARRRQMTKPLDELFTEFKNRLEQIPDQAQRARYDVKAKNRRARRSAISGARVKPQPDEASNETDGTDGGQ